MPKQVKLHNNALRKKNFGVATQQTNIFNALSGASQLTQLQLMVLAKSGDSPVSNAFTAEADRLGLTPQAREREDARKLTESLAALEEPRAVAVSGTAQSARSGEHGGAA